MRKLWKLAFANLRQAKANAVSLLAMFFIAALLLNDGLLVFIKFGDFYNQTTKELNSSDIYYVLPSRLYTDEVTSYLQNNNNVKRLQKEEAYTLSAEVKYKKETREDFFLLSDADEERQMSKWKFVGKHLPADSMSIYVPYVYQLDAGYKLNDSFVMKLADQELTFTIKGFTEDVFFSSTDTAIMGIYLPHGTYTEVASKLKDENRSTVIFANLKKVNKQIETEIREMTGAQPLSMAMDPSNVLISIDKSLVELSRTMMAMMVSVMFVVFAAIVVVVCLIVVRFRIGNAIEDDMTKIGSLKAIGYTSKQIILSIAMQFSLIAIIGTLLGIALSYPTIPLISDIFAQQSGLHWVQGFDPVISSVTFIVLFGIVAVTAYFAAGRIHKLSPIVALRGGTSTQTFRKNRVPLHTSKGGLPIVMAFKSMLQNRKQSIMMAIIIIAVSFTGVFSVVMFYNTVIDISTFEETPGIERSNSAVILKPDTDRQSIVKSIEAMKHVKKVTFIDEAPVIAEKNELSAYVMDDYAKKETKTIYDGRYPKNSKEVAIAGSVATMLDKSIGDQITLNVGNTEANYQVTGLTQGASMGGMNVSLTKAGIQKLRPDFKQQNLQIYLEEGTNATPFTKKLEKQLEDQIVQAIDMDEEFKVGVSMYTDIVSKVGIAMLVVTIAVVILVLYFVIGSSIVRRKRELGIQKAIGYTTWQLMNQCSFGFLPPILIGVIIGCALGMTQTNAIMSMGQRSMGIMKANYIIEPLWIGLFGLAVLLISYGTAMLITYRIRKISAYALVTE